MTPTQSRPLARRWFPLFLLLAATACGAPQLDEVVLSEDYALVTNVIEAESMTFSKPSIQVKSAASASGGKYLAITEGQANRGVTLPGAINRLTVRARGVSCAGTAPRMVLKIDGTAVHSTPVVETAWADFSVDHPLPAGAHTFSVAMWNSAKSGSCTVALHVDKLSLEQTCVPTTCAAAGASCGAIEDGCGGTLSCGSCGAGEACGSDQTCRPAARYPGHVPGKFVLGMSCGSLCAEKEAQLAQPYGVHRQFTTWNAWSGIASDIQRDHALNRIPWISIKPPNGAAGWLPLANGQYDADIRALAATLKANDDKPILLTLHHEPSNDAPESEGINWARAYARFHDVLSAEGALVNVAHAPIVGDWLFNPSNGAQDPANWVTADVMKRMPFLGIDLYENGSGDGFDVRLNRIISWMAARGFPGKMVGIGEMGCTDAAFPAKSAVQCLNENLGWAKANTDKIGVISYFNSTANSKDYVYWPLDESAAKLNAFRYWLNDAASVP